MKRAFKHFVKRTIASLGYEIFPIDRSAPHQPTFADALSRLKLRNPKFQSVIDVGAAVGGWSEKLAARFPGRQHLLIEANPVHTEALDRVCARHANWSYVLKACGPEQGKVYFDGRDPFGGQAKLSQPEGADASIEMTSIDQEVSSRQIKSPYLIKLDTHGFEIPILKGATKVLEQTEVLIVEVYNFPIGSEAVRFWEMCSWLQKIGFLPIDAYDLLYRPMDNAFWQMDLLFVRSSAPEFGSASYR